MTEAYDEIKEMCDRDTEEKHRLQLECTTTQQNLDSVRREHHALEAQMQAEAQVCADQGECCSAPKPAASAALPFFLRGAPFLELRSSALDT